MINVLRRRDHDQRRLRRGMYLLPSLFTLANMFCGYACVIYAMRPEVCRTCMPGDVECAMARKRHGLLPVVPANAGTHTA